VPDDVRGIAGAWRRIARGAVALAVLLAPAAAAAQEPDEALVLDVDLAATVQDVAAVQSQDGPLLMAVGPARTWIVQGEQITTLPLGGHAIVGGRADQAFVCTDQGLVQVRRQPDGAWAGSAAVSEPCRALAVLPPVDSAQRLLLAGSDLRIRTLSDSGDATERRLELPLQGWPVLAVDGKRFAVVTEGGQALLEEGPWGTSSLATGGPVGGLAAGASSWTWSLPDQDVLVDVTRRRLDVAPGPGALAHGDVDGDGLRDLLVAHPDHPVLGLVRGGSREEQALPAPTGIRRLSAANLDQDACDEVVILTASGRLQVWGQPCGDARPRAVTAVDEPGVDPLAPTPRQPLSVGGEAREQVEVGVGERVDLQLVDAEGQASAFAASGGPSALVVTSSGTVLYRARPADVGRWKVSVRLWEDGSWARRSGFDLVVVGADSGGGPNRVSRTTGDLAEALGEDVGGLERRLPVRGCLFGIGGALGGSQGRSWVTLGDGFLLSGGPALAFTCDGGGPQDSPFWWFAGLDMAPFFVYVVDDNELRHGLSATLGAGWHRDTLYAGVYVTAGATLLGAGPVVRWLPLQVPSGRRQGLELRMTWMPTKEPTFEGVLLYTMQIGAYGRHRPGDAE